MRRKIGKWNRICEGEGKGSIGWGNAKGRALRIMTYSKGRAPFCVNFQRMQLESNGESQRPNKQRERDERIRERGGGEKEKRDRAGGQRNIETHTDWERERHREKTEIGQERERHRNTQR